MKLGDTVPCAEHWGTAPGYAKAECNGLSFDKKEAVKEKL